MRKLEEGEYDAIILAAAGLTRLGKTELVKEVLSEDFMCPAAGQGALGIEIREGDVAMREHLAFLNDSAAHAATTCERALLNKLGGGCQVPIGAFAEMKDGELASDRHRCASRRHGGPARAAEWQRPGCARRKSWRHSAAPGRDQDSGRGLWRGSRSATAAVRNCGRSQWPVVSSQSPVVSGRWSSSRIGQTFSLCHPERRRRWVCDAGVEGPLPWQIFHAQAHDGPWRPSPAAAFWSRAPRSKRALFLRRCANWVATSSKFPSSRFASPVPTSRWIPHCGTFATYDWLILTSVNGVEALFERLAKKKLATSALAHLKIAAIGPATRKAIEQHGLRVTVTPKEYVAESVVASLRRRVKGKRVLLVRAKVARDVIPRELRKAGARLMSSRPTRRSRRDRPRSGCAPLSPARRAGRTPLPSPVRLR